MWKLGYNWKPQAVLFSLCVHRKPPLPDRMVGEEEWSLPLRSFSQFGTHTHTHTQTIERITEEQMDKLKTTNKQCLLSLGLRPPVCAICPRRFLVLCGSRNASFAIV